MAASPPIERHTLTLGQFPAPLYPHLCISRANRRLTGDRPEAALGAGSGRVKCAHCQRAQSCGGPGPAGLVHMHSVRQRLIWLVPFVAELAPAALA